jgi:hypothetical protein
MKCGLFVGVAAVVLTTAMPFVAAPLGAAPATAAPQPAPGVPYDQVKAAADKLWDRMDVNHDGKVDAADHDARLLEHFARWDTNHDGVISKEEFLAFAHAREAHGMGHRPGDPDRGVDHGDDHGEGPWARGGPGHGPGGFAAMAIAGWAFHAARKDGVVTRAAFDAAVKARFDALDANHDGTLTREELRAAWRGGRGHHEWGPDHPGHPHNGDAPPAPPANPQ